jgi:uncharacterized protein with von Willebrand factor type A (vWA) domain
MDQTLAGFVRAFRAAGADASTAEALDAARAVALMGYADRATLKASLGVVLAKSEAEKALHDDVFELYFQPPARAEQRPADGEDASPGAHGASDADNAEGASPASTGDADLDALLALVASAQGGEPGKGPAEPGAALTAALQRAAKAVGVDDIRFASQTAYLSRRMLETLGIAPLEARLLARLGERGADAVAEAQALTAARDTLQRHARALVEQRFELFGKPATDAFLTEVAVQRPLGRMSPPDIARMKVAVARMARRLAIKHSQRRRIRLHGQLDFRRTLRRSAGHDGVPFQLHFKTRRRDKPRLVVVCDVSASVAPHVRFLLMFLYALQGAVTDLHTFAFSNRLMDVEAPLERLPFDDAMELIIREVGSGATDYGQAWQDLHDRHWQAIDRRTTVLVLGDGRSNGGDPRLDLFTDLANRAKRLVWLCPEPPGRWGTGDSCMLQYRPHCTHAGYVATAADLERAIDEALEAYT